MTADGASRALSVLVVAENISPRLSGETVLPCYYLDRFRKAGVEVRAICHERCREELCESLPSDQFERIDFVPDSLIQRALHALGRRFPYRIEDLIFNQLIHIVTQLKMRSRVRRIIAEHGIDVVFQPAPIAPSALNYLHGLDAPVVIGPMSGGMDLPPAFRHLESPFVRWAIRKARAAAGLLHRIVPGKLQADALIVANRRTRKALPRGVQGRIFQVAESAVDLDRWHQRPAPPEPADGVVSFIFCSRFVDWKGVRYLVDAFAPLAREGGMRLDLVGDGEMFEEIRAQVDTLGIGDSVVMHGRLALDDYIALLRKTDVYVSPSLRECGGIAMLEAMAIGLPVVAVNWGGAAQYAGRDGAMLIDPVSERSLVGGMTRAMRNLARSPELRHIQGEAARRRVEQDDTDWNSKAEHVLDILEEVALDHRYAMSGRTDVPEGAPLHIASIALDLPQPEPAGLPRHEAYHDQ